MLQTFLFFDMKQEISCVSYFPQMKVLMLINDSDG